MKYHVLVRMKIFLRCVHTLGTQYIRWFYYRKQAFDLPSVRKPSYVIMADCDCLTQKGPSFIENHQIE